MRLIRMYVSLWDSGSNSGKRRWSIVGTGGKKLNIFSAFHSLSQTDLGGGKKQITLRPSETVPGNLPRVSHSTGYDFMILNFYISSLERAWICNGASLFAVASKLAKQKFKHL